MKNIYDVNKIDCGLSTKTINLINGVFAKYSAIKRAILYGSRAKGNYRNGSDIDLTLCSDDVSHRLLVAILVDLDELLLPYMIDLSFYTQIENENLQEHIARVGVVFYEKNTLETL